MAAEYDASEFVDDDFHSGRKPPPPASPFASPAPVAAPDSLRAPTREEVEGRVSEMQQKLAALKQAQQDLLSKSTSQTRSIAVLPFNDLSPAEDQDYFGDGMAEEILTALAKVAFALIPNWPGDAPVPLLPVPP